MGKIAEFKKRTDELEQLKDAMDNLGNLGNLAVLQQRLDKHVSSLETCREYLGGVADGFDERLTEIEESIHAYENRWGREAAVQSLAAEIASSFRNASERLDAERDVGNLLKDMIVVSGEEIEKALPRVLVLLSPRTFGRAIHSAG